MVAISRFITADNPTQLVITGLSLRPCQRLIVTVIDAADDSRAAWSSELQRAFKQIQQETSRLNLSDQDISAEITAHRHTRNS